VEDCPRCAADVVKVLEHTNTNMPPKTTEKAVEKPAAAEVEGARQK
jgi:hypothetical protein